MLTLILIIIIVVLVVASVPVLRRKASARAMQPIGRLRFRLGLQTGRATVRAVVRQVKAHAQVMLSNVWLPNNVIVYMNEAELEGLGGAKQQLADDIRRAIEQEALPDGRTRVPSHYFVPEGVLVRLVPDTDIQPGVYRIEAWIEEKTILDHSAKSGSTGSTLPPTLSSLLLYIRNGADRRAYPLPPGRSIVGRGAAATIRITNEGVSREHAELNVDPPRVSVTDLGSRNGTWVAGKRIDGMVDLAIGQRFRLGRNVEAYVSDDLVPA